MIRGSTQPLTSIPTQRFCSIFQTADTAFANFRQVGAVGPALSPWVGLVLLVAVIAVEEEALGSDLADQWKADLAKIAPTPDLE